MMTGITRPAGENAPVTAAGWRAAGWRTAVARWLGAGLLAATGAIHLDLYLTGYRTIPTIGWLFLLQIITAFALAAAVAATPLLGQAGGPPGRLAALAGAGFSLATLGGYLLSVWAGLFGFREVRTASGVAAGIVEVAAFAALAAVALAPGAAGPPESAGPPAAPARRAGLAVTGLTAVALVLLGVGAAGAASGSSGTPAAHGALRAVTIKGTPVLANAKGLTLYWFVPDSATASKCYGTCATYWPPVTGTATAGPGVTGRLGTIQRTGGTRQVTYDGHPLYTYVGDSAPGQASGNGISLNGGRWHEMTIAGTG